MLTFIACQPLLCSHHPTRALRPQQGLQPDPEPQGTLLDGDRERSEHQVRPSSATARDPRCQSGRKFST